MNIFKLKPLEETKGMKLSRDEEKYNSALSKCKSCIFLWVILLLSGLVGYGLYYFSGNSEVETNVFFHVIYLTVIGLIIIIHLIGLLIGVLFGLKGIIIFLVLAGIIATIKDYLVNFFTQSTLYLKISTIIPESQIKYYLSLILLLLIIFVSILVFIKNLKKVNDLYYDANIKYYNRINRSSTVEDVRAAYTDEFSTKKKLNNLEKHTEPISKEIESDMDLPF